MKVERMNPKILTARSRTPKILVSVLVVLSICAIALASSTSASARVGKLVSSVRQEAVNLFKAASTAKATPVAATAGITPLVSVSSPNFATRDLRVVSQSVPNGTSTVTMTVQYEAQGGEKAIGFSVHFDPTYLALNADPSAVLVGSDPQGIPTNSTLITNPGFFPPSPGDGNVGFGVTFGNSGNPGVVLAAQTYKVLTMTFTVLAPAQCGVVIPVDVTSGPPTQLSSSDAGGSALPNPNPIAGSLTVAGSVITFSPLTLPGGTISTPYSQQITASGGAGGFTYSLMAGTLPTGITLSAAGLLSGTPTQAGTFPGIQVKATDSNGCFNTITYSLTIACGTITLSPVTLPGAVLSTPYSQTVSATPAGTYTFGVTAGALPTELTLNTSTGQITGTPTTAAGSPFNFTITATGVGPCTGSRAYSIAVTCPTITLTPGPGALTSAAANIPYTQNFSGNGGTGPYTFARTAGTLPPPLALSSAGVLSGTPTTPGGYSFTITATDSSGCTGSAAYTLQITCPILTMTPAAGALPSATAGTAYSQNFVASNGTGALTYTISLGALPAGLTLSTAGALTGSPTATGSFSFSVRAADTNNCSVTQAYTLQVGCQTITVSPATIPNPTSGVPYSQNITQTGGIGSTTFAISAGALPAGLTLSTGGVLSGTPTVTGPFNFTARATDANGCTGTQAYSITIACGTLVLSPAAGALPAATATVAYSQSITSTGGTTPKTYAITTGSLPSNLTLSPAGLISGTPVAPGSFSFTVTGTDVNGCTGSAAYTLQVNCPTITFAPLTLPNGTINVAYSQQITASGAGGGFTYLLTGGTLPTGVTLSPTGLLSGTPTQTGVFPNLQVQATATSGCVATQTYSLTISCPVAITLSPLTLPAALLGVPYSQAVTASPAGSYTYSVSSGSLPTGLTLNPANGQITGTPTSAAGSPFNFGITATGAGPCVGTQNYSIAVTCPAVSLTPAAGALPGGTANTPYSQSISATGTTGPFTFAVTAGTLPPSVTLSTAGLLSGTPTTPGSYSFTVTATSTINGCTGSAAYTLQIACPILTMTPAAGALPGATAGTAYSQNFVASNGTGSLTYTIALGALPAGLTLSTAGALTGSPTVVGPFSFSVKATDTNNCSVTQAYTLQVACPSITVNPATIPNPTSGVAYSQNITQTGGIGSVSFAISAGALPAGLTLSTAGLLSGTPTVTGPFGFTVRATDANGCTGTQAYSITIACGTLALNPAAGALPGGSATVAYSQQITSTGGIAPVTYAITGGTLPANLTLSTAGLIAGIPAAPGSSSFTVTATDKNGCTGSAAYTLEVTCPTTTFAPLTLPNGTINVPYSQQITASGAGTGYVYALIGGSLPTGITLSPTGLLSGTPTVTGLFTGLQVQATATSGCVGTQTYSLTIQCPVAITLAPASVPNALLGVAYSTTVTASPAGSYTYAVAIGSLPGGLTLNPSNGQITGTPTTAAGSPFNFTISATGPGPCVGSQAYSIAVACPTVSLTPAAGALPGGTANTAYSQQLSAAGTTGPFTFAVTGGTLPPSLTLSPAGLLSGAPSTPGSYSFTVTATSTPNGCTGSAAYTLQISCPILTMTPAAGALPAATGNTAYSQNFVASNGTGALTYTVVSGALPTGLTLSTAGALTGTPTVTGGFSFSVKATDVNNCSVTQAYTLGVSCPTITISPASLPGGTAGVVYPNQNITQTGGVGAVTFSISVGALPTGMTMSTAGVISGTPTVIGDFGFTVLATDANGCTGSKVYSLSILCATIAFTPAPGVLPTANTSANYNQQLTVTGTLGTKTFALASGNPPAGITLSTAGLLSGTPTVLGNFAFTARVTDANGCTATAQYGVEVFCGTLLLNAAPNASINVPYSQSLAGGGGSAPHTFSVTAGTLPVGLTLSPTTGLLSGTPTVVADYNFDVTDSDANGCNGTRSYALRVLPCTPITVAPATIPAGFLGVFYSQTFTQTGAVGSTTFSLTGALPGGLTFANGVLSGTPTQSGIFPITVDVTDSRGCPGSTSYQLNIQRVEFSQSDESSGSVLVYNFYTSSVSLASEDTRINLTNTSQNRSTFVHLFFIDGATCSVADAAVCLTASQTLSFLASAYDPGTRGYLIAIATDSLGCPTNFNFLIGDAYVKLSTGHQANLSAEAISALSDAPAQCDANSLTALIAFDGVRYSALPRVLALDSINSRANGNNTMLIVNRISGNLMESASSIGSLFGILYDDGEGAHSFNLSAPACQLRIVLSNNTPRTTPRFEDVIPAGTTGWMKFWSQSDAALLGSSINFNPNAVTSADSFSQGHNLHKLKLTNSGSLTMPIFPPHC
jgi:large repetitive protein